jgi:hypothetical protein
MDPIVCPSCGSKYNPETRELVEDTRLRERIRQLEADAAILRSGSEALTAQLAEANEKILVLSAPPNGPDPEPAPVRKKERKFIVARI